MKLKEIIDVLDLELLNLESEDYLDHEYRYVFTADLMSDALYVINQHRHNTILLTALCNSQSLRTAEMLDLTLVIYALDKAVTPEMLKIAKESHINIAVSKDTLFKCSGILYENGLQEAE